MGMRPAPRRPTLPWASPRLTMAATLSDPCSCWVMPIDQTSTAVLADAYMRAKRSMSARVAPDCRSRSVKDSCFEQFRAARRSLRCARARTHGRCHRSASSTFSTPLTKRDVATGVHREELVGHLRAEHRALDVARHPVAVEARLAHRVDDRDLRAALARQVQVLHEHRLRVGDVGTEEHDQVALDDIGVRARGRAHADRALQRGGRRRVADPRRVVDVVRAEEAGDLLRDVVGLVGDAARGEVDGRAARACWHGCVRRRGRALRPR